ncbi:hypothetical protein SEA_OLANP_41 [Mycobacterium phage OlanP]|nr:hypothetical protein SEA_OLANP_41 [Mycobacterium phage OlanP]UAW08697.1 hypothetical protein SEA_HAVEUMETTED_43 [Mycobacterium phage HaveUMetTed]
MKKFIAAALIALATVGLTACEPVESDGSYDDTYPHGFIYVPRVGTSPGIGPIFY